jgi:hypothetical protein
MAVRSIKRLAVIVLAITALISLASCGGGGGSLIPPDAEMRIILASGGGAIFPAGSFAAATDVDVTEDPTGAMNDAAGYPADSGELLGMTRIIVPAGAVLDKNVTVLIALGDPAAANLEFTVFKFNGTTNMWESTSGGASGAHDVSALARVEDGDVLSFLAPTAGTTGLDVAYGVFANYSDEIPGGGGSNNHIPTVSLDASKTNPAVDESITLTATGADDDSDTLTFTWLSPGGTLGAPNTVGNTSTASWSAATGGTYVISVSCSDGNGGVATDAVTITVPVSGGGGGNNGPEITAVSATPSTVAPSSNLNLACTASDPDGDTLTYAWSGTGTFGSAGQASSTWQHDTLGSYALTITVSDPDGASTSQSVVVTVANPNNVPVLEDLTSLVAAPVVGQKVIIEVTITDTDGDTLNVNWDDGSGSGNFSGSTFDPATGVAMTTWTAPAEGDFTITALADDGKAAAAIKAGSVVAEATIVLTVAAMPTDFDFVGYATCLGCHSDKGDEGAGTGFFTTNHSKAIEKSLSDPANAHAYKNQACYACHALGWEPNDSGQGFIDIDLTPQFRDIQCESCHGGGATTGMGAGHKTQNWDPLTGMVFDAVNNTWVPDNDFDSTTGVGCGACHEGSRHGAVEEWARSGHATFPAAPLTEDDGGTLVVGPPGEAGCVKCHNGQYFVSMQIDGGAAPADDLPVEDMNAGMYITCATCHDPHESTNEKQLRVGDTDPVIIPWDDTPVNGGWGNICLKCHNGRRTRTDYTTQTTNPGSSMRGPHGNAQGAMFFGLMGADFAGVVQDYDTESAHRTWNDNSCVTCHMWRQAYISPTDPASFGHDWEPVWENCNKCHPQITDEATRDTYLEDFQAEVDAMLQDFVDAWPVAWKDVTDPANPVLNHRNATDGTGDTGPYNVPAGPLDAAQIKGNTYRECLWNYKLVLSDATHGAHNPNFVKSLMEKSIAKVNELNAAP